MQRHEFHSMGLDIAVMAQLTADARQDGDFLRVVGAVQRVFEQVDARFSRFREDSELSAVNGRAGRPQTVSEPFAELLQMSLSAARATEGLFDPTVLPALLAAGYDRDFDELVASTPLVRTPPATPTRWRDVVLEGRLLFLPKGAALDFGGIAKGWAADLAADSVESLGWILIDAAGDLRLTGQPTEPVPIGVADPAAPGVEILQLEVEGGALATSSVAGRTWGVGLHHLIDPRTSLPACTDVVQSTVWAPTCAEAEVLAKWALLSGPSVLPMTPAALVLTDGRVLTSFAGTQRREWRAC
jgi:thiamine biosynthesis lipoprotein